MAALQDPSKIAGTEAGQEPAGLHKQLLDQKNGYVQPDKTREPCPMGREEEGILGRGYKDGEGENERCTPLILIEGFLTIICGSSKQGDTYVSPSDAIMSPASQKLQGFKQRQINKQRTPSGNEGGSDEQSAEQERS
ncbi:hypothetical protein D0866_09947 [Hortaea werneckii]|uniref:Uncharacterized protein n=1 Tax=Hortaea werneckii TaxID=91943 RepID=A0A3M7AJH4_HORWE|nr:hypothetical protein D0866_09947 [Hortaea werneckii]